MPKSQKCLLASGQTQERVSKDAHKTVNMIPRVSGSEKEEGFCLIL